MKATKKQAGKRSGRGGGAGGGAAPKRARIAPNLAAMVRCGSGWALGSPSDAAAAAEFRALLAVAKAAKAEVAYFGETPAEVIASASDYVPAFVNVCRALARLSRAGGEAK